MRRAGARGRVTEYGLGIDRILLDTQSRWQDVGPDLEFRLSGAPEPSDTNIVPLPSRKVAMTLPNIDDGKEWSLAAAILYQEDPQCFAAWLAPLRRKGRAGGRLMLLAPSRFHAHYVATHFRERLVTICQSVDAQISDIVIEHD